MSSIAIDYAIKRIFLYGSVDGRNIMISMNYDGQKKEKTIEGRIQAFAMSANMIYWKFENNTVINVMKRKIKEIYQNIPLFRQWTNLSAILVMDNVEQSIGKSTRIFELFRPSIYFMG